MPSTRSRKPLSSAGGVGDTDRVAPRDALAFLAKLLSQIERQQIRYCVLRGDIVAESGRDDTEVDILVERRQLAQLSDVLGRFGFVAERAFGHAPHTFFAAVDAESGQRLTVDVVTDLRYGRPIRALRFGSVSEYLARRERSAVGYGLAPEDEFRHLLLHCSLDKGEIDDRHRARLESLAQTLGKDPDVARRFVQNQRTVSWHLFAASPVRTSWLWLTGLLVRRLGPLFHAGRGRGLVVAVLGPDGAGKSTLAHALVRSHRRARRVYMGYGRDGGTRHPAAIDWLLRCARPSITNTEGFAGALSGTGRFAARCILQFGRGITVRIHRRLGRLVVLDRHFWDSEQAGQPARAMVRLRRRIVSALCPVPDLVIVLDAPAEVLHRRRPEHSLEALAAGRAAYRKLADSAAHAFVLDASASVDRIRHQVAARLWQLRRTSAQARHA